MSVRGLAWQKLELPFSAGLAQKADDRARPAPYLDIARDVQFSIGGVETRLPFGSAEGSIFGGGTIANARRIETVNGERVLFTSDSLYSWNAQLSKWVLRGTHLAVAVDEKPTFVTTGDQLDGDRAELSGTVVFAWAEGAQVYAAALDKTTGSVLVTPTAVSTAIGRPRLVALATKILLFVEATTTLLTVRSIDPAAPGTAIAGAGTTVLTTDFNLYYDVVKVGSQDLCVGACRRVTTTSYTIFTVTPALVVTTSTKARTCDGPIAVSTIPAGTSTQVVRGNAGNIQGDFITTATLADVTTGQAIGTAAASPNQIACCHRSVQNGGAFRCYAFWSAQETTTSDTTLTKFNFVDSAGTIGTQANFARHLGVASRAFDFNGSVYLWLAFAGQSTFNGAADLGFQSFATQNTYFLYRDDAYLANAKCVATHGGGFAPSTGRLPGVALTSGTTVYSWCATERRRLELGGIKHVGFASRAPVDVTFEFDTNRARRCARLGRTLYVGGGEIMAYDGTRLVEVGHHVYPWIFGLIDAGGGSMATGAYLYKWTLRYENAQGEIDRSTTATTGKVVVSGSSTSLPAPFVPYTATHKTAVPPAMEGWRTLKDPPPTDAPFYLVTSQDPTALTNPNRYIPNDPTAASLPTFNDFAADATVSALEQNPENEGVLENLSPPPAQIVIATETRLVLARVAGDEDAIWYSRERAENEVASFHEALRFEAPRAGGDITSIIFLDQQLLVFRQTAIYGFVGPGLDNLGRGQQFTLVRTLSLDIGAVSHEAVAFVAQMGVVFKSKKGWQLLGHGGDIRFIGGAVSDYDAETILSIDVVETQHQVRILSASRMLVWDYRGAVDANAPDGLGQWFEWTISDGVHSTMFSGSHVYLTATGPKTQSASYSGLTYGMDLETAWIKLAGLQGAAACKAVQFLGEYRSAHLARVRIAYNYKQTGSTPDYVDDKAWSPTPTTVGGPLQLRHSPKRPRCEAIKVRITAVAAGGQSTIDVTTGDPVSTVGGGGAWAASFSAKTGNLAVIGELGDAITLTLGFVTGSPNVIDVRDHFTFDPASGLWSPDVSNVGVRVVCAAGSLTVAALEAAIVAGTALIELITPDPSPTDTINITAMSGQVATVTAFEGFFSSPTGEAMKLTGLGLEVGVDPAGLFNRLPAAQRM